MKVDQVADRIKRSVLGSNLKTKKKVILKLAYSKSRVSVEKGNLKGGVSQSGVHRDDKKITYSF